MIAQLEGFEYNILSVEVICFTKHKMSILENHIDTFINKTFKIKKILEI